MQKSDHGSLINVYGLIGTQERVTVRQGKLSIRVRTTEVILCKDIFYAKNNHDSYSSFCVGHSIQV